MLITEQRKLELTGLVSLGIGVRQHLDRIERAISDIVEPERERQEWTEAGSEAVYNGGDDVATAVEETLRRYGVGVEG